MLLYFKRYHFAIVEYRNFHSRPLIFIKYLYMLTLQINDFCHCGRYCVLKQIYVKLFTKHQQTSSQPKAERREQGWEEEWASGLR